MQFDEYIFTQEYLDWIYNTENIEDNYDVEYTDLPKEEIENQIGLGYLFDSLIFDKGFPYEYEEKFFFPEANVYFSIKDKFFKLSSTNGLGRSESLKLLTKEEDKKKCKPLI